MSKNFDSIFILAYPDNPTGAVFIETFLEKDVPLRGVVVEKKAAKSNRSRLLQKLQKDGLSATLQRVFQIIQLKLNRRNIIDMAHKHHIPVYFVDKFNSEDCVDLLKGLHIDYLVIASAPILKTEVFGQARIGCLNAHPGLLPKYRGIGANAYALSNGDDAGVSVHWVDAGIDTGKIIIREVMPLKNGDTVAKINDRVTMRGAELICEVIFKNREGNLTYPKIVETTGPVYKAMPYRKVRKINDQLKKGFKISNAI